jgi:excisionase family DNA binding protein
MPTPAMISVAAAGREIGKSPASVVRLIHAGEVAAFKVGRTYKIARTDLDAFLERARVRPRLQSDRLDQAVANHRHAAAERRCLRAGI